MTERSDDWLTTRRSRIRWSFIAGMYWSRLRHRWLQELLAVVGIAAGVALLFASQVASTSLSGPVKTLNDGVVGNSQWQVRSRGPDGFDEGLYGRIRQIPGVARAAPILQVQGNVVGSRGRAQSITVYGADPRVVRLRGSLLRGFSNADAASQRTIVVPNPIASRIGVHFGDTAQLQIRGRTEPVPVATVGRPELGGLVDMAIAIAPLNFVQGLARLPGRVSGILVQAQPGRAGAVGAELRRLAGDRLDVRPADYEVRLFETAAAPTTQATTISSVVSAMVGFLFALCAMLVTVASRRSLALDLRLEGYRPGQVIRVMSIDAVVLGTVSVAAGLVVGDALSRHGYGSDVSFLGGAFPMGSSRIVTWTSIAIAAAGGYLAAIVGVLAPIRGVTFARTALRADQATAFGGPRRRDRQMIAAGLVLLAGSVAITVLAPGAAVVGLVALALSLLLLTPAMLTAVIGVLSWVSGHRDPSIHAVELALPQLREGEWRARTLAIAMTGAIAVFGAVSLQGARTNLQAGLDGVSGELDSVAQVWVTPPGAGSIFATNPFQAAIAPKLAALPGVAGVSAYRAGLLDIAGNRAWVIAPPQTAVHPIPKTQIRDGNPAQATARIRAGGWATVSRAVADALHLKIGQRFTLPSPIPTAFRVAAITTNFGWSGGSITLNADDYARAWGSSAVSAYLVQLKAGVTPSVGRDRVAGALGPRSALQAETASERHDRQKAASRSGLARLSQVAWLTLVAAVLAMGSAMAALLWQRRPTVARQKLHGKSTAIMWQTLAVESATLFVTGCLAGAVFGLLGQVLFSRGLEVISGFPVDSGIQVGVAVVSFALVTVVAMLVVAIPGYLVARVRPSLRIGD